jgi:hypothetical protein
MNMKKVLILLAVTLSTAFVTEAFAQRKSIEVTPEKGAKPSGVKLPDFSAPAQQPDKSRGQCCLNFDNWTGYYLDVWVDDVYRGRIAPWDYDGLCVAGGFTKWYVQSADGTYWWKNSYSNCDGTTWTIKLN